MGAEYLSHANIWKQSKGNVFHLGEGHTEESVYIAWRLRKGNREFAQIYNTFIIDDVYPGLSSPGEGNPDLKIMSCIRCKYVGRFLIKFQVVLQCFT